VEERRPGEWTEARGVTAKRELYVDCDPATASATDAEKKSRMPNNYFAVNEHPHSLFLIVLCFHMYLIILFPCKTLPIFLTVPYFPKQNFKVGVSFCNSYQLNTLKSHCLFKSLITGEAMYI
jgi:hypothetical protein